MGLRSLRTRELQKTSRLGMGSFAASADWAVFKFNYLMSSSLSIFK